MKSCCVTDVGQKRTMNQDFVYASDGPIGNLPNLFVVADGMGGHQAGDLASRYTVETILDSVRSDKETNLIRVIRKAIETANREVLNRAEGDPDLKGMGSTVVVATIDGDYLYVANVGDSRLYLVQDEIKQVTKDHSWVEEMVRIGELRREQARNHPDKNIITRAVGASRKLRIDFFDMKLQKGDIILMCSDGLSNMLEDKEIENIIKEGKSLQETAYELVMRANQQGGKDNIAVVLIDPQTGEVKEC